MSARDAMDALEAQLDGAPPAGLGQLSEAELRDLLEVIRAAKRTQARELRTAGEKAYSHIPWLLRGPVRKIVG